MRTITMARTIRNLALLALAALTGCHSPYHTDRGALAGGLFGTGMGAAIGSGSGNTAEGAIVGAAVGALTGGAIGHAIDESEARNRALIAAQLGREIPPNAVALNDVIAMSQAGVSDELIVTHVRAHGMVAPLTPQDLITAKQAGISDVVVLAMQQPPIQVASLPPPVPVPAGPVVIEEHHHYRPWPPGCGPRRPVFPHGRRYAPGVSFGVSYGN
jgi:hypothetical protein